MRALTVYQERILSNMEPPERVRTALIAVVEMSFLPIAHFLTGMTILPCYRVPTRPRTASMTLFPWTAVDALCQSLLLAALTTMSTPTPPLAHAPRASPAMPLPLAPRRHTKWTLRPPETCRANAVATWGQGVCYYLLLLFWWGHVGRLLPPASASTTPRAESRAAVHGRSMWHPPTPSRAVVSAVLPLRAAVVLGWLLAPAEAAPTPDLPLPPRAAGVKYL